MRFHRTMQSLLLAILMIIPYTSNASAGAPNWTIPDTMDTGKDAEGFATLTRGDSDLGGQFLTATCAAGPFNGLVEFNMEFKIGKDQIGDMLFLQLVGKESIHDKTILPISILPDGTLFLCQSMDYAFSYELGGWNKLKIILDFTNKQYVIQVNGVEKKIDPTKVLNAYCPPDQLMHSLKFSLGKNTQITFRTLSVNMDDLSVMTGSGDIAGDQSAVVKDIHIVLNGERISMDGLVVNGEVMAPVQQLFARMGAFAWRDDKSRSINVLHDGKTLRMDLGGNTAWVNGAETRMGQPPVIYNNKAYIPLRFVCEALGGGVEGDVMGDVITVNMPTQNYGDAAYKPLPAPAKEAFYVGPHFLTGARTIPMPADLEANYNNFLDVDNWKESYQKIDGVKFYINGLVNGGRYDYSKLIHMISERNLKVIVELGGCRIRDIFEHGASAGEESAKAEIAVLKEWIEAGGRIDYITTDHCIMWFIRDERAQYPKQYIEQALLEQMDYFKTFQDWLPGVKCGMIESLGFFNITDV